MKRFVLSAAVAAVAFSAAPAFAADMPVKALKAPVYVSPWDVAFGTALATDYVLRGISQSDRMPSVSGYFEPRYNITPNLQIYAGILGLSVEPSLGGAEFDLYAGIRPTWGPLAFDFGVTSYYYTTNPNGAVPIGNTDFTEVYAKVAWAVTDSFTLGLNGTYSDDVGSTGFSYYWVSGTAKYVLPGTYLPWSLGAYVSAEIGYQDFDPPVPAVGPQDYTFWNVGGGFTYKAATLDLRYHDTDLSSTECVLTNGGLAGSAGYCGSVFVAKLSFDTTLSAIK